MTTLNHNTQHITTTYIEYQHSAHHHNVHKIATFSTSLHNYTKSQLQATRVARDAAGDTGAPPGLQFTNQICTVCGLYIVLLQALCIKKCNRLNNAKIFGQGGLTPPRTPFPLTHKTSKWHHGCVFLASRCTAAFGQRLARKQLANNSALSAAYFHY